MSRTNDCPARRRPCSSHEPDANGSLSQSPRSIDFLYSWSPPSCTISTVSVNQGSHNAVAVFYIGCLKHYLTAGPPHCGQPPLIMCRFGLPLIQLRCMFYFSESTIPINIVVRNSCLNLTANAIIYIKSFEFQHWSFKWPKKKKTKTLNFKPRFSSC